jgi:hypothetical protein
MKAGMKIGIALHDPGDTSFEFGPLKIISMSTDEYCWGSTEFQWNESRCLYCHYFEEMDPYKYETTGHGEPEWFISTHKAGEPYRVLWSSSKYLYPLWDFYRGIKNKFIHKRLHRT